MTDCRRIGGRLPEFAAGELPPALVAAVREHLLSCNGCRTLAGSLQRARGALRGAAGRSVGPDDAAFAAMGESILQRVAALPAPPQVVPQPVRPRWPWVAAAAMLVGLGLSLWSQPASPAMLGRDPLAVQPAVHNAYGVESLGFEDTLAAPGQGMRGRVVLRSLEEMVHVSFEPNRILRRRPLGADNAPGERPNGR